MGINLSHNRSVCLMRDGEVIVAVEEERLDRIKHSEGFLVVGYFDRLSKTLPMKGITYCLDAAGIGIDDLDLVIGNRPLNDGSARRILRDLPIKDKSKVRELPQPSHHLAHAYSGYFSSGFDEAAVVVVDGIGSRVPGSGRVEKHAIYRARGTEIELLSAASFAPDYSEFGLGLMYEFFTAKLGFITRWGHESWGSFGSGGYLEAGKTMGLASYGRPRPDWGPLLRCEGDDIIVTLPELEDAYRRWHEAEGQGYDPASRQSWESQFAKDIARKAQDEVEAGLMHLVRRAHELTGSRRLCLVGGVALNSVANQRIAAEGPFEEIFILPPAGDEGVSIGCAAYGYYELLGGTNRATVETPALGRGYSRDEVLRALKESSGETAYHEADIPEVAELLAAHRTIGWFQGGSEMGPRALGHRSMLADPRHPDMRDYLNIVVKHREPFRPYAPSVLYERAGEWFDLAIDSPHMLLCPLVRPECRDRVPAITHVDGTARVQTVRESVNPRYHKLISSFHRITGVPMVLNTSFNDAGEPIVESPADAVRTFLRTELDHLYIGPYLVSKRDRVMPAGHPASRPV